jgi:stage II sporulation protein AA (anti-sigma F factor antagonist)
MSDDEPDLFSTTTEQRQAIWVLRARGELDVATAPKLADAVDAAIASGARNVMLELDDVTFLDSSGIREIIRGRKQLEEHGGRLTVDGASGAVQQVLEVSGLLESLSERNT